MTNQNTITKSTKGIRVYETMEKINELRNESFRSVFNREISYNQMMRKHVKGYETLWCIKRKIANYQKKVDVRKAIEPNGVSR